MGILANNLDFCAYMIMVRLYDTVHFYMIFIGCSINLILAFTYIPICPT